MYSFTTIHLLSSLTSLRFSAKDLALESFALYLHNIHLQHFSPFGYASVFSFSPFSYSDSLLLLFILSLFSHSLILSPFSYSLPLWQQFQRYKFQYENYKTLLLYIVPCMYYLHLFHHKYVNNFKIAPKVWALASTPQRYIWSTMNWCNTHRHLVNLG